MTNRHVWLLQDQEALLMVVTLPPYLLKKFKH